MDTNIEPSDILMLYDIYVAFCKGGAFVYHPTSFVRSGEGYKVEAKNKPFSHYYVISKNDEREYLATAHENKVPVILLEDFFKAEKQAFLLGKIKFSL